MRTKNKKMKSAKVELYIYILMYRETSGIF